MRYRDTSAPGPSSSSPRTRTSSFPIIRSLRISRGASIGSGRPGGGSALPIGTVAALDPGKIADRLLQVAAPFLSSIGDAACAIREGLARGEEVLFEGAQGALLDLDYGTYPYVTSSSTTFYPHG